MLYAIGTSLPFWGRAIGKNAGKRTGALSLVAGNVTTIRGAFETSKGENGSAISITQFAKVCCADCDVSVNCAIIN